VRWAVVPGDHTSPRRASSAAPTRIQTFSNFGVFQVHVQRAGSAAGLQMEDTVSCLTARRSAQGLRLIEEPPPAVGGIPGMPGQERSK
jgi:hypothetical protein